MNEYVQPGKHCIRLSARYECAVNINAIHHASSDSMCVL